MTIEHNVITDPEIHEPKGASTAGIRTQYVSDGAGSGSWIEPEPKGAASATLNELYVADGAGGGAFRKTSLASHAQMVLTNNVAVTAVVAAVDPTLNTDTDYVKITAGWASSHVAGITFNVDELVADVSGDYMINFWAAVKIPNTNSFTALKYAIDDTPPYSLQKIVTQSSTANDYRNIFASGIVTLTVGQTVSVYTASSKTNNLVYEEAGLQMTLIHEN
jgi:hypothetical protein